MYHTVDSGKVRAEGEVGAVMSCRVLPPFGDKSTILGSMRKHVHFVIKWQNIE
jgi:hypothetical protein